MRWDWWRRTRDPDPPQGVRLVRADGTALPIEVVYAGYREGIHHWTMVCPYAYNSNSDRLQIDVLPAHTAVDFQLAMP